MRLRPGIRYILPPAVHRTASATMPLLALHPEAKIVRVQLRQNLALKQLTAPHLPKLVVLSYNEITRDTIVEAVGMVSDMVPK